MTGGVHGGGLGLAEPGAGAHGEHQPFVGHVLDLRALLGVAQQAALGFEEDDVEPRQQLVVRQLGQGLVQVGVVHAHRATPGGAPLPLRARRPGAWA